LPPHDPNPLLDGLAQMDLDGPIPLIHQPPSLTQRMKLTDLARYVPALPSRR
jgi:hypothetical protein